MDHLIIHKQDILNDEKSLSEFQDWLTYNKVQPKQYFLIIGRFVPENSYEVMIREFMASNTKKDLVIVTTENGKFFDYLEKAASFYKGFQNQICRNDIYDTSLLNAIRVNAFAYIHGHSVGGTNPSLLESLGSTDINLLARCRI
jgi:rhamnosyltransferase